MKKRNPGYREWQWSQILHRCLSLPPGIFEVIVDYLPPSRVWQWSLWRLKRRIKLAPQQAIKDIGCIVDEILTDASIFTGRPQNQLLVRLSRNQQVCMYNVL